MQRLEVSGAVRLIYRSLGVKGLSGIRHYFFNYQLYKQERASKNKTENLSKNVTLRCHTEDWHLCHPAQGILSTDDSADGASCDKNER